VWFNGIVEMPIDVGIAQVPKAFHNVERKRIVIIEQKDAHGIQIYKEASAE
jgi:hypothetical protein